jgi:nitrogen fixation/metabolism regulation signal transduction histidine kinase
VLAINVLFDEAAFNENTAKFVALLQGDLTAKQVEMDDLKASLTTQFIIAFVIVVVAAVVIALLLTRMIVRPINKLNKVANEISQGETELSMPEIKSRDEIGDLAKSFGRMIASIKFMMTDKEG